MDQYIFVKMIDSDKNVSIVRNTKDGKNYVQKEHKYYNKSIFEQLKGHFNGIPRIYECIESGNKLITIEDYIQGTDLESLVEENGSLDENQVKSIVIQICDVLKQLHSLNPPLIHRDIKPSNIIMSAMGKIVLIDFNISHEYKEDYSVDTVVMGTRHFAAPEQLTGYSASDERTDIFSIGATLNYLLSQMYIDELIVLGSFESIIKKCCMPDKKDRYQNVDELKKAVMDLKINPY